jgi:hypothetical protein
MRGNDSCLVLTSHQTVKKVLQKIFGLRPADPKYREGAAGAFFLRTGFDSISRDLNIDHPRKKLNLTLSSYAITTSGARDCTSPLQGMVGILPIQIQGLKNGEGGGTASDF